MFPEAGNFEKRSTSCLVEQNCETTCSADGGGVCLSNETTKNGSLKKWRTHDLFTAYSETALVRNGKQDS